MQEEERKLEVQSIEDSITPAERQQLKEAKGVHSQSVHLLCVVFFFILFIFLFILFYIF
jgi:hypothetical protein